MTLRDAGGLRSRAPQGAEGDARASFDAPDAVHRIGPYVVRRAQPEDALNYCRTDAVMVSGSYPGVMPPIWSQERLDEADGLAPERALAFAANLAAEARGEEPPADGRDPHEVRGGEDGRIGHGPIIGARRRQRFSSYAPLRITMSHGAPWRARSSQSIDRISVPLKSMSSFSTTWGGRNGARPSVSAAMIAICHGILSSTSRIAGESIPKGRISRESHEGEVQLLITDVVMPGMGGRELAERLAREQAGIRILFMSGYSDDVVSGHGIDPSSVAFLQKPFSAGDLARKVREVLDRQSPSLGPPGQPR